MARYTFLSGSKATVSAKARSLLLGALSLTNADRNVIPGTITTLDVALAAAQAEYKQIGIEVKVDFGSGLMTTVPNSEVVNDLSISESLDGYADQLTLSLVGNRYSPWISGFVRGKHAVELWISYGSPGRHYLAKVFTGYVVTAQFDYHPPVAHLTCFDSAVIYSEDIADYNLPVNSDKTRLEILNALLAGGLHGPVPVGSIQLPNGDGGKVKKSISTGPQTKRFDLIREAICVPTGTDLYFSNGRVNLRPYDSNATIQRVIKRSDIASPLTTATPDTIGGNAVTVVSVEFKQDNDDGTHTTENIVTTSKLYSRASYINLLDTAGVITPSGMAQESATLREVSRVITRTTTRGSVLIFQQIDEWGWYAPKVCIQALYPSDGTHPDPFVDKRHGFNFFQFPDGTWRTNTAETYRLVRRTITKKDLDESLFVIGQKEERYFYHFIDQAILQCEHSGGGAELFIGASPVPLTENGDGALFGQETIGLLAESGGGMESGLAAQSLLLHPDSSTLTEWDIDPNGAIKSQSIVETSWGDGFDTFKGSPDAFRYGVQNTKYQSLPHGEFDSNTVRSQVTNTQVSEERYLINQSRDDGHGAVFTSSSGSGAIPKAEQVLPLSTSFELRSTLKDGVRVLLNGEVQVPIQNQYCESPEEVRRVAATALRELSAWTVMIPMPLEGQIHKAMTIAIEGLPEIGIDGRRLYVWSVQRDFGRFSQTIVGKFYPPEVASI